MDTFWIELFAQSRQVEAANARKERALAAAEQARIDTIIAAIRESNSVRRDKFSSHPKHKFHSYGSPHLPGCVRCPYPKIHSVHRSRSR